MAVTTVFDATEAERKLKKLKNMKRAFQFQGEAWKGQTVKLIKQNISGSGVLKTRTGHLRRNVDGIVRVMGSQVNITIGTGLAGRGPVKYASILEKGGTITPKRAKALTIPMPGIKGRASNYANVFVWRKNRKSRSGPAFLAQKKGLKSIRLLFLLKKKVKIPAKKWLSSPIKKQTPALKRMFSPSEILKIIERIG